jgi:hypothetical protein
MTMKTSQTTFFGALLLGASLALAGCGKGSSVEGNTYQAAGIKIVFASGGAANVSMGPATQKCTYNQAAKTVTLTCEGQNVVLTVNDDGSLNAQEFGRIPKTS